MKHIHHVALYVLGAAFCALISCNDPTVIGSDLLSGDQLDIDFTDTVTIKASVQKQDSVRTFDPAFLGSDFSAFLCGHFSDPVFGKSNASINAQFALNTSKPDFAGSTVDSIVLILPWRSDRTYGKLDETYKIDVFQLDEKLAKKKYFSNRSFNTIAVPIGSLDFTPSPTDSVSVIKPAKDSVIFEKLAPQLRIRLDDDFASAFFNADVLNFAKDSAFQEFFYGVSIRAASQNAGMLAFNLRNSATAIKVYYNRGDSVFSNYSFPIFSTNVVTTTFEHDYAGATVDDFISKSGMTVSDSLLFIQGISGVNTIIEVPYVQSFPNVIINRAELEFTILRLPGDDIIYAAPVQIVVSEMVGDSIVGIVDDIQFAINRAGNNFNQIFGGDVDADGKYRLNISSHFQDMMRGRRSNKMRIEVFTKPERAGRVVVGGPGHSVSPVKLNLSFTRF